MKRLDYKIRESFIPAILNRAFSCTDLNRRIFGLPARDGGLSIYNLSETSDMEYQFSCQATSGLTEAILNQDTEYHEDSQRLKDIKVRITKTRKQFFKSKRDELVSELSQGQKLQLDLAAEKGASSWLTTLPVKEFGYVLTSKNLMTRLH